MTSRWILSLAAAATSCFLGSSSTRAADAPAAPPKGDLWEQTSQMAIEGMPIALPARKVKICTEKEWTAPPAATDPRQRCESSDFHREGSKVTFKMTCAGPPPTTGEGEIIRDGDSAYSGTVKFTSAEGAMTLRLNGTRLGDCDPPKR